MLRFKTTFYSLIARLWDRVGGNCGNWGSESLSHLGRWHKIQLLRPQPFHPIMAWATGIPGRCRDPASGSWSLLQTPKWPPSNPAAAAFAWPRLSPLLGMCPAAPQLHTFADSSSLPLPDNFAFRAPTQVPPDCPPGAQMAVTASVSHFCSSTSPANCFPPISTINFYKARTQFTSLSPYSTYHWPGGEASIQQNTIIIRRYFK